MKQIRGRPMAGCTVLISGDTAGIGKATARHLNPPSFRSPSRAGDGSLLHPQQTREIA
jgi:hypothetical protein